ncbi:MAG: ATP-binding protein [Paracoccaceae bacterium]
MQLKIDNFLPSVVARMRLGWLVIVALLVLEFAASIIGLNIVQSTQKALSEDAVPALEQFGQVRDELAVLDAKVDFLVRAVDTSAHDTFMDEAMGSLTRLDALMRQSNETPVIIQALQSSLHNLNDIGHLRLNNNENIAMVGLQTAQIGQSSISDISRHILDIGTMLEASILTGAAVGTSPDQLMQQVSELNTLTQLGSTMMRTAETIDALMLTQADIPFRELKERLAFEFRSAVHDLVLLSPTAFRQKLATSINALRALALDSDGLVALQEQKIRIATASDQNRAHIQDLLTQATTNTSASVLKAKDSITSAAGLIDGTVDVTISLLMALGVVIILALTLAAFFLLERQVISRLRKLTRSVREIASGNNDWCVSVDGADEFGEMASALEIFKANSKELHRSNEELGRFAYAASHDLRSPLRAIQDLAEWTIEDAGSALPEDCRLNLDLILDRAGRLNKLLDGLFDYSHVGREKANVVAFDVDWMVADIVDLLGATDRFQVSLDGQGGTVRTYEAPFRQVLQNLINNAIKHHDRDTGLIAVTYQQTAERITLTVSDDGPGIAPEYHEKVFELFQTLQSQDRVEGSGMGLSIIRKQVEQHGGTLTVQSDPSRQRGTTFTFDWPLITEKNDNKIAA